MKHFILFLLLVITQYGCQKMSDQPILPLGGDAYQKYVASGTGQKSLNPFGKMKDIDGNTYKTIKINNLIWMAENLKVTRYKNGDLIAHIPDASSWVTTNQGAWCDYDNLSPNDATYGKMYNFFAVSDSRGLAPKGWHIPTLTEWNNIVNYLGGYYLAGGPMKEMGLLHWLSPNYGATNSSNFTGLPCGVRNYTTGVFSEVGQSGFWWGSTPYNIDNATIIKIDNITTIAGIGYAQMNYGFAIRCVQDY